MGRRKKIEEIGVTIEDVVALYRQLGTAERVGRKLSISERTVRKYLTECGETLRRGRRAGDAGGHYHFSRFAKWLRENPGTPLPRSIRGIASITGLKPNDVKTYLYRRRRSVQAFVESLPDLTRRNVLMVDRDGRKIPTRAFQYYIISINRWTLEIIIRAVLKNNRPYIFIYSMDELRILVDREPSQPSPELPEESRSQDSDTVLGQTTQD